MKKKVIKCIACAMLISGLAGDVFAAAGSVKENQIPTQQTTPSTYTNEKKTQPFVLDNFKVIELTLKHFGVDSTELANYIKQGKKLEDVLKAEKISVRRFKKCVIQEYYKAVEEGLKNKQLTPEQANQLKAAIKETVKGWLPRK